MKICFVALTAYAVLSGKNLGHTIGPDVYQFLLGKELLERGFSVSFITHDEGGSPVEWLNGLEVIKVYRRVNRPNLMLKILSIWKALSKAKADIYFQQGGASFVTPLFCRWHKKPCVVSIGQNAYVSKTINATFLFRSGSNLEIRLADFISVQTRFQQAMLKRNFGRDGLIVKSPFPLLPGKAPQKAESASVLWVGSTSRIKQPELFFKLAAMVPEAKFNMIIAEGNDADYDRRINRASQSIPNLNFLGFVPFAEINQYFEETSILINTSMSEGFPFTFIQAWMNHKPVVSLNADPDELICEHRLGFHSRTLEQLAKDIRVLLKDEQLRKEMGENGRRYVEREHDIAKITNEYVEVFNSLGEKPAGRRANLVKEQIRVADKLRIGIVGCGPVAEEQHIPSFLRLKKNVILQAVCDINENLARQIAKKFGIPTAYGDLVQMLTKEHLNVIDICTPPQTHAALAVAAMERGCHVLLEKPMALKTSECDLMVETARKCGVKLCVVHSHLFRQAFLQARKLVDEGAIGDFIGMRIFLSDTKEDSVMKKDHWIHKLPGGLMEETAPHVVYMSLAFLNSVKSVDIYARSFLEHPWAPFDEFKIELQGEKASSSIAISYASNRSNLLVDIQGTDGALYMDVPSRLLVHQGEKHLRGPLAHARYLAHISGQVAQCVISNGLKVVTGRSLDSHAVLIERFVSSLLTGQPLPVTGEEGRETTRVVEMIVDELHQKYNDAYGTRTSALSAGQGSL